VFCVKTGCAQVLIGETGWRIMGGMRTRIHNGPWDDDAVDDDGEPEELEGWFV
jgi:hypothetical protein